MKKYLILALAALLAGFQVMTAIPARPGKFVYVQPDGSRIELQRHGDEFCHWTTDAAGRMVDMAEDGFYRPVTGITVDDLQRKASPRRAEVRRMRSAVAARAAAGDPVAIGRKHFLVILVEFSDKSFTTSEDANAAFTALLNQEGYSENGGTGSARDFYYENSHGIFEPVFDVYGPVKLDKKVSYYGSNTTNGDDKYAYEAVVEGCKLLDDQIDFTRYDNDGDGAVDLVFMYYAGKGEADGGATTTIWPHQWSLAAAGTSLKLDNMRINTYACANEVQGSGKMCGIGAACHEFAHAMGLPDFYDADYGINGHAAGLFFFSTMDGGAYNNQGRTPPYFNIEERIMLGWVKREDVLLEFPTSGMYTIPSVQENVAYMTMTDMDGEYFVYECRGSNGWDAGLSAHGLVVYHVDRSDRLVNVNGSNRTASDIWNQMTVLNAVNENGSHPCFYIIPSADQNNLLFGHRLYAGNYYFDESYSDQIPFPGSKNVTEYTPLSWNGVEGDVSFRNISYADDLVTLEAQTPPDDLEYNMIADAGTYRTGDRFTFALVEAKDHTPAGIAWYFDDEPVTADSVTLTAGAHTVEAVLTYADGRKEVLSLEIDVQ